MCIRDSDTSAPLASAAAVAAAAVATVIIAIKQNMKKTKTKKVERKKDVQNERDGRQEGGCYEHVLLLTFWSRTSG